jgi:Uma2 family endonuclease
MGEIASRNEEPAMGTTEESPIPRTLAELVERLGDIPLNRIRLQPAPGTATEADVIAIEGRENRLCELVDGVLVEKATRFREACLAGVYLALLREFIVPRNLGVVSGADGMVSLFPGLVRIPDVAFVSWERLPGRRMPTDPAPRLAPDLAVEVLSPSNTEAEMVRKRREYFGAGVRLVWLVDPDARTVAAYTAPEEFRVLDATQVLDGSDVLPGFEAPIAPLFAELDREGNR